MKQNEMGVTCSTEKKNARVSVERALGKAGETAFGLLSIFLLSRT
jgi:hypothetical protein